jgi:dolichol-phosphate mannosyltransferase
MSVRARQLGLGVREIPIVFTDRVEGRSKLSRRIVMEAAWVAWVLRFTRPPERSQQALAAPGAESRRSA